MNIDWNVWKTEERGEGFKQYSFVRASYHNTIGILVGNGGVGKSNSYSQPEVIQSSMTGLYHSLIWKVSKYWSHVWNITGR